MRKRDDTSMRGRLSLILVFFLVAFSALAGRLFSLQIVRHGFYQEMAARQYNFGNEADAKRGTIFAQDKNGETFPLAIPSTDKNLIAVPKNIKNPDEVKNFLMEEFHLPEADILERITKVNDPYEQLIKKVDPVQALALTDKLPTGLFFEDIKGRAYPHGTLAAHVLGFISKNQTSGKGTYGLERQYQVDLAGEKSFLEGAEGTANFWSALGRRIINPPKDGSNLLLTIDYNIQQEAEKTLAAAKEKWAATSGTVLVLDPMTGKILADASLPAFDPNDYGKERDLSVFLNPAVESTYEFGSVVKPVIMASGLEEKLITPATIYYDTGEAKFGSYTIRNFDLQAYHIQTMTQVLEKSLNTGMIFVSKLLGHDRQLQYLQKFGFGEKTNIELPGEVSGNISNLASGKDIDFATASFGQGIAATPLQLAMAIGAIADGGVLKKPYIVDTITDSSGVVTQTHPQDIRQVISKETAEMLSKMLVSVVRNGFENHAGVKGYFVAGKTGTAQIPKTNGKGYSDSVIHTFVGYAPAFKPRFLILLQLNEPKGNRFAANTLTPAFHDLAQYILNYYEIPPDEK